MARELSMREVLEASIMIIKKAKNKDLAVFIDNANMNGVKVKDNDPVHLVVNKSIEKKAVKRMIRGYVDSLITDLDYDIDKDLKMSIFDIYIKGKNWYIEVKDDITKA